MNFQCICNYALCWPGHRAKMV